MPPVRRPRPTSTRATCRLHGRPVVGQRRERLDQLHDRWISSTTASPCPRRRRPPCRARSVLPGDTVTVTGGTNWWGGADGAPDAEPDRRRPEQCRRLLPGRRAERLHRDQPGHRGAGGQLDRHHPGQHATPAPGRRRPPSGRNPCTLTVGQPTGTFQVPSGLAPGAYNIYVDESNTTPLPGNGPNDAYQTATGTNLGTAESVDADRRRGRDGGQDLDHRLCRRRVLASR